MSRTTSLLQPLIFLRLSASHCKGGVTLERQKTQKKLRRAYVHKRAWTLVSRRIKLEAPWAEGQRVTQKAQRINQRASVAVCWSVSKGYLSEMGAVQSCVCVCVCVCVCLCVAAEELSVN